MTVHNGGFTEPINTNYISRNDPVNRWGNVVSSFQLLPGLIGFWPMSSVQLSTGSVYDLSGQGRTLTLSDAGASGSNFNIHNSIVPYIDLDGVDDHLFRFDEDDLKVIGTETIYPSSLRGLTWGGWFYLDETGTSDGLIGKWTESTNQRSWLLLTNGGAFRIALSSTGTGAFAMNHNQIFATASSWFFVVARWVPGTVAALFVNGIWVETGISIPATLFNSTAALQIGAYNGGNQNLNGRASLCFVSGNALPKPLVDMLFQQSRVLFGV